MALADIVWTDDKVGELIGLKNNIIRAYIFLSTLTHTCTTTFAWRFSSSLTSQNTKSYKAIDMQDQPVRSGGTGQNGEY